MEQARQDLEQLGLAQAAAQPQAPYAELLADRLGAEAAARRARSLVTRTRLAHLPVQRTRSPVDVACHPSLDERQVRELATMAFVAAAANVLLLGPPGVGKPDLAVALGRQPIEHGHGVHCARAHDLMADLRRAQAAHRLDRRLRVSLAPKVLIIDEFGVWPYDRAAATALATSISARDERRSVILTSNNGLAEGGEGLGDPVVATAILDRLLHHSHGLTFRRERSRRREQKRAGVFGTPTTPPTRPDRPAGTV